MEFDWTRILKGQGSPATEPRPPVEARRAAARQPALATAHAGAGERRLNGRSPPSLTATPRVCRGRRREPAIRSRAGRGQRTERNAPRPNRCRPSQTRSRRRRTPRSAPKVSGSSAPGTPSCWRGFPSGPDETRRAELKQQADRLNPDSWVTDDEVAQGLEQYESVLASLREVAGQKRRRRRRGKGPRPAGPGEGDAAGLRAPTSTDQAAGPEACVDETHETIPGWIRSRTAAPTPDES